MVSSTPETCAAAQAEDVVIGSRQSAQGQTYAVEYIRQQVIAAVGWDRAMNEGFRIRTTIDADLQKVAEESLKANLDRVEQTPGYNHETYEAYAARFRVAKKAGTINPNAAPEYLQGAVIALDNQTGGILALVGGRDFEHNQFDRALQARRPAGTAFTPFVFAAAFEKGLYPGTVVEDSALDNRVGHDRRHDRNPRRMGTGKSGQSLRRSDDRAAGAREIEERRDRPHRLAERRRFGFAACAKRAESNRRCVLIPRHFSAAAKSRWPSSRSLTPASPAAARAPNAPYILERIEEKNGKIVWQSAQQENAPAGDESRRLPTKCIRAWSMRFAPAPARPPRHSLGLKDFPAAGKTGTAYDFTEALFVGYDNAITCAVRAGFDKPQKIFRGAFGREIALPVWVDIMNASLTHYPAKEISKPANLETVEICAKSGLLATDKCPREDVYRELATKEQMPTDPCDVHGDARTRIAHDLPDAGVPRASLAVDTAQVQAVAVKGPTLLADNDPYNAIKSTVKPPSRPSSPNRK